MGTFGLGRRLLALYLMDKNIWISHFAQDFTFSARIFFDTPFFCLRHLSLFSFHSVLDCLHFTAFFWHLADANYGSLALFSGSDST